MDEGIDTGLYRYVLRDECLKKISKHYKIVMLCKIKKTTRFLNWFIVCTVKGIFGRTINHFLKEI